MNNVRVFDTNTVEVPSELRLLFGAKLSDINKPKKKFLKKFDKNKINIRALNLFSSIKRNVIRDETTFGLPNDKCKLNYSMKELKQHIVNELNIQPSDIFHINNKAIQDFIDDRDEVKCLQNLFI
jgi:hypothetical protein